MPSVPPHASSLPLPMSSESQQEPNPRKAVKSIRTVHTPEVFSQLPNRCVMQKMEERKATMCPSRSSQEQDTGRRGPEKNQLAFPFRSQGWKGHLGSTDFILPVSFKLESVVPAIHFMSLGEKMQLNVSAIRGRRSRKKMGGQLCGRTIPWEMEHPSPGQGTTSSFPR